MVAISVAVAMGQIRYWAVTWRLSHGFPVDAKINLFMHMSTWRERAETERRLCELGQLSIPPDLIKHALIATPIFALIVRTPESRW